MLRRLVFLAFTLLLIAAFLVYSKMQQLASQPLQLSEPLFTVPVGASALGLCRQWQRQQLLSEQDCHLLRLSLYLQPELAAVQAGTYRVSPQQSVIEVLQHFVRGEEAQFAFTWREGETLQQTLERLEQADYLVFDLNEHKLLSLLQWPESWGEAPEKGEGLFFPDTYHYTANSRASQLLSRAHQRLLQQLEHSWHYRSLDNPLQTPYELLIMASIIEKEAGHEPEKPLVSSVFANRLRSNMRLQTDPTVIYGLENFSGRITRADLNNPHPYNTYRHHGLPPGPISSVSRSSLLAAAQPAETTLYYFVSRGDGTHVFSETLQEHNAAVRRYILGQNND